MKKDVAASAAGAVAPKKSEFSLIDEDLLKSRIYTIRGVKVLLDADLAEIYGYSTKDFNRQVKNNIKKFDADFRFQLTKAEVENLSRSNFLTLEPQNSLNFANSGQKDNLRCKNCTSSDGDKLEPQKILRSKKSASSWGGARYAPYAFTEQGIYMLMTVLKGEQATAQSKALIRLFKQMKDYIAAENAPDVSAGMVALATQGRGEQDYDHHAAGRYRGVSRTVREATARGGMITGISIFTKFFVLAHTLAARILPRHHLCPLRHAQAPGPYLVT